MDVFVIVLAVLVMLACTCTCTCSWQMAVEDPMTALVDGGRSTALSRTVDVAGDQRRVAGVADARAAAGYAAVRGVNGRQAQRVCLSALCMLGVRVGVVLVGELVEGVLECLGHGGQRGTEVKMDVSVYL